MERCNQLYRFKSLAMICAAVYFSSVHCAVFAIIEVPACPEGVAQASIKLENIPSGWTPYIARPLYLHAAAPIDGPPERRGQLADYEERQSKHATTYIYKFEGAYPEGKWLQCSYGEYGQVTLSRRIDDRIQKCELTYRSGAKAGQKDINIQCN
ncbi:STY0301 family protein [Pseudoduganella violacea]|uniref:Uncharacterized protein n=1 Tax=Pseudoduganella violacea TaxID=1715466 RepID=A0A7W5B8U2_9BURK|nr:STY0301 family protein [Pseudoduganella violacea]MBB3118644.1 hypothetical protein [Pseudoduganella violacea]